MDKIQNIILSIFSKDMDPDEKINLMVALIHLTNIKIKKQKDEEKNNIRKYKLLFADSCKPIVKQLKNTKGYYNAFVIYEEQIKQNIISDCKKLIYDKIKDDIIKNGLEDVVKNIFD
jgi:hypothetical protein